MSADPRGDFLAFCRSVGLPPVREPDLPDGQLVRYRSEGDKSGARNAWAVLHLTPSPWGIVGSWKTGEQHAWRPDIGRKLTAKEIAAQRRQAHAARAAREAERLALQTSVRLKAQTLWSRAKPARPDHPYLLRKAIKPAGLRQLGDRLVVPLRDVDGCLWSLQFIDVDGSKRFLTGGRTAGLYFAVGSVLDRLIVAEGVATGISLWLATGSAVAVAFSAGNLKAVALALRRKFPALPIVLAADDDTQTAGNPGRTAATEAARAVGGFVVLPRLAINP